MIKFSILLPTRNRLELLKYAVKSVQMQEYENWELIISDNCSEDDVQSWVTSLQDDRILYYRQTRILSVTENWNEATKKATGDYKIMLGDDDALLPNALMTLYSKIIAYNMPDLIVFPAILYLQPEVDPVITGGDISRMYPILEYQDKETEIPLEDRKKMVEACCKFERTLGYNMQYYCYSAKLEYQVSTLGQIYEPPYPDYYTSCCMLYIAKKVICITDEVTIIGITPKSYGYYYRNNIEKEGMEFHKEKEFRALAPQYIRDSLCSIDEMNTASITTFALLAQRIEGLSINLINYYKAVLQSQSYYMEKNKLINFFEREMISHIDEKEKNNLYEYIEKIYIEKEDNKDIILGTQLFPFFTIMQVIENIDIIRKGLKLSHIRFDIDYWIKNLDGAMFLEYEHIYIWGAYERGKVIREELQNKGISIKGYIDNNITKREYDGMKVYLPDILREKKRLVIIAHKWIHKSIIDYLNKNHYTSIDGYLYKKIE